MLIFKFSNFSIMMRKMMMITVTLMIMVTSMMISLRIIMIMMMILLSLGWMGFSFQAKPFALKSIMTTF